MTVADHNHTASLLHHVRCAKEAMKRGNLAAANRNLEIARSLAWQLPKVRQKARIVAGIAQMQAQSDQRYAAMQASIDAFPPTVMDLMKDYGEGELTRRPRR